MFVCALVIDLWYCDYILQPAGYWYVGVFICYVVCIHRVLSFSKPSTNSSPLHKLFQIPQFFTLSAQELHHADVSEIVNDCYTPASSMVIMDRIFFKSMTRSS